MNFYVIGLAAMGLWIFGLSSCTYYDPAYVGGPAVYGGGVTSSVLISTGDPRWGYDPDCYAYYDYHRGCYYDPYLYGYYPSGYRPVLVYGVPHPHGWRPGHGHPRPPYQIHNRTLNRHHDRIAAYREHHYSWAENVRHSGARRSEGYRSEVRPSEGYRREARPREGFRSEGYRADGNQAARQSILDRDPNSSGHYRVPSRPDGGRHEDRLTPPRSRAAESRAYQPRSQSSGPATGRSARGPFSGRGASPATPPPATRDATRSLRPERSQDHPRGESQPDPKRSDSEQPYRHGLRSLGQG